MFTSYFIYFFIFAGPTEGLTIASSEYIFPNTCNNITCYYESYIDQRTTTYVVVANGNSIFSHNILQKLSSNLCTLDGKQHCNDIGICLCDPNGLSTRICYNHTSGGEGQLTLRCESNKEQMETFVTIAAIPSNVYPNNTIYRVDEGSNFGPLICNASCGPPCTFRWVGPTSIINSSELFINHATLIDNGIYQCEATNKMGTSKGHIVIIINYGPNQVILSPNRTSYTFDENIDVPDITCTADCQPDCTLTWIKQTGQVISTEILSLKEIQRNQAGTYQCNASNDFGNMVSTDVTISVRYGPSRVVLSPNETKYEIKENESLQTSISCTATCQPPCVGTWTIHTGEFVSYDNLSLPAIKRNQTGFYRCNISNIVSSMTSMDVSVIVTYGAEIKGLTIDGENFTIPENVETRLACEIDGIPKPNGRLFYNEEEKQISGNPIIYPLVSSCNDTGNYTCAAENSIGKANQTKELFVLCSPRPVARLQSRIAVGNDSILNISLILFSYPQPKISWMFSKNGSYEKVRSNDIIGIHQHISSIYITDMKTSQYGMYVLEATNGIPNDFKHVFEVLPQRQPDIPTHFSASCDAPNYANLQWIPSSDGGDTQQFKLYYAVQDRQIVFSKHREDIKEDENELLNFERVDGLLPATSYVFKLIAYNTFGESNCIKAYCNTTKSGIV
ncbi:Hypothetical predicted protein [Mytilus galloprovincialis]|uniref:Uncharacterized protein n=1 Tax=Mytilus galloprovincialis TaxID=29158 RepID=A0A8B6BPK8_MYTGA|nr:Hypothetical predicted protein [Mytilus galloprovincialis]